MIAKFKTSDYGNLLHPDQVVIPVASMKDLILKMVPGKVFITKWCANHFCRKIGLSMKKDTHTMNTNKNDAEIKNQQNTAMLRFLLLRHKFAITQELYVNIDEIGLQLLHFGQHGASTKRL